MKEINIAEGLGKKILKHLNDYYEEISMGDDEYIPLIKRIIESIHDYEGMGEISDPEKEALKTNLLNYSKGLYVELCQIHSKEDKEDISPEQVKEEAEEFFDYVYKHGRYPE
ncbi:MAG: hypothetical protein GX846_02175 [Deltaproteobacteria bacterium]|jgi:hypothetical protein|nr:hypothetical protein [Deltaproteobacteria bacterium]